MIEIKNNDGVWIKAEIENIYQEHLFCLKINEEEHFVDHKQLYLKEEDDTFDVHSSVNIAKYEIEENKWIDVEVLAIRGSFATIQYKNQEKFEIVKIIKVEKLKKTNQR